MTTGVGILDGRRSSILLAQCGILVAALAVRLLVLSRGPYLVFPDETFQYLEYGHYFAYRSGVMPWEFFRGMRSYLLPGVVAAVIDVQRLSGTTDPTIYIYLIKGGCILLSLSVVYVGFRLGLRTFGLAGAAITGSICAVWFELIYFAPALLTEVVGSHVALWGIYLLETEIKSFRRVLWAGVLLGLATCLRFHLAPALFAAAVWQLRWDMRAWKAVLIGGGLTLLLFSGLLDFVTLGLPFQSIWYNFWVNMVEGVSGGYGKASTSWYMLAIMASWTLVALPLAVLAVIGAMRVPSLAIATVVVLLSHTLIAHKEYRFVYFALMSAPILIGVGASVLFAHFAGAMRERWLWTGRAGFVGVVAAASYFAATHGTLADRFGMSRNRFEATFAAHHLTDMCGLGVSDMLWASTGGYSYLNRDIPIYYSDYSPVTLDDGMEVMLEGKKVPQYAGRELLRHTERFNYILRPQGQSVPNYRTAACFDDPGGGDPVCLDRREGSCR